MIGSRTTLNFAFVAPALHFQRRGTLKRVFILKDNANCGRSLDGVIGSMFARISVKMGALLIGSRPCGYRHGILPAWHPAQRVIRFSSEPSPAWPRNALW